MRRDHLETFRACGVETHPVYGIGRKRHLSSPKKEAVRERGDFAARIVEDLMRSVLQPITDEHKKRRQP
jgi:hypothetical protein